MPVLPLPITHTGARSEAISPSRMSQVSGDTECTRVLDSGSGWFASMLTPTASISLSATIRTELAVRRRDR